MCATGTHADHRKIWPLNLEGKHHRVPGPLNTVRPPQVQPVFGRPGDHRATTGSNHCHANTGGPSHGLRHSYSHRPALVGCQKTGRDPCA